MPRYVLECSAFDASGACVQQAWVEQSSILETLPTVDEAHMIGNAMLIAVVSICAAGLLFKNSKGNDDE